MRRQFHTSLCKDCTSAASHPSSCASRIIWLRPYLVDFYACLAAAVCWQAFSILYLHDCVCTLWDGTACRQAL